MPTFNKCLLTMAILSCSTHSFAQEGKIEEMLVTSSKTSFANSDVSESMMDQQNSISSVLSVVDNIPGVLINEGDVFGSDDWSTTVSIRGFQLSLDEQQIGMTIDGIPNGNSNYGGGSKANRFVDAENLKTVRVSQGTADIASRSLEALGGTLDFVTQNPEEEKRTRFSLTEGDYNAKKYFVRHDTGLLFNDTTVAYLSYSDSDVNSWIDQSGESTRNHIAFKSMTDLSWTDITVYASYDDTAEDNYQRITAAEFDENPDWDRLTGEWTGIPYIDQVYRRGWSTLRENFLAYAKFEFQPSDSLDFQITPYMHQNEGRGDWLPPYVVDVVDDGADNPHSELSSGNTVYGGEALGEIAYTSVAGVSMPLSTDADCASLISPYGGTAGGSEYLDPNCYASNAIPVGSFRHTHYEKERVGVTGDLDWSATLGSIDNLLRAGFWYENQTRTESRDWHRIIDSSVGYHFDHTPYWVQYDREYPQTTTMVYIEDSVQIASLTARLGFKQWFVDVEREDYFDSVTGSAAVSSDSDVLPYFGLVWEPKAGLELFTGYAENFAAIKDSVLEAADLANNPSALSDIKPETAENFDFGLRFENNQFQTSATFYKTDFSNRITFIADGGVGAPDYLGDDDGTFLNVGGIESSGIELSGKWFATENLSLYASYTQNDSEYIGIDGATIEFEESIGIYRGNTVFGSAEDMYVVSLDWQEGNFRAGYSLKHVGERWLDTTNNQRVDAYDVSDIYVAVVGDSLGGENKGYELRFTLNNVFDEDYIGGVAGGWGGWIGGGRTAAFNLKLDF